MAVVFSNEANATTSAASSGGGGSGGGPPPLGHNGSLNVSGKAYPNSNVTMLLDGVIVGNNTANNSGDYSFSFSDLTPRSYSIGIYATDTNGTRSPTLGLERTVATSTTTTVNETNVAPTIRQSHSSVRQGESITFSGTSAPNVPISVSIIGPRNSNVSVTSNASGNYSYSLPTTGWPMGSYTVYSDALINNLRTPNSFALSFTISESTVLPPPPPPTPGTCARSDLSCDGKVDLVDFSILLFYWEVTDFSRNPKVDINKDGTIGIKDLSIMLYDWTG